MGTFSSKSGSRNRVKSTPVAAAALTAALFVTGCGDDGERANVRRVLHEMDLSTWETSEAFMARLRSISVTGCPQEFAAAYVDLTIACEQHGVAKRELDVFKANHESTSGQLGDGVAVFFGAKKEKDIRDEGLHAYTKEMSAKDRTVQALNRFSGVATKYGIDMHKPGATF